MEKLIEKKRNTVQRQLILNAVSELNTHASAEQVYEHVVKKYPNISRATVYRNLNQMAEAGEIMNIGYFDGSAHYDHNCHDHYHFMCNDCKRIFDVEADFSDIIEKAGKSEGFDIIDFYLSFSGLCRECKEVLNGKRGT